MNYRHKSRKLKSLTTSLLCLCTICAILVAFKDKQSPLGEHRDDTLAQLPTHIDNSAKDIEIPQFTIKRNEERIKHIGYTVSYNPDWCIPNWVAYELTDYEANGTEERAKHFVPDPDVKSFCPESHEYANSGFDRGHMAPAGDMKWSEQAMRESFYLTNICPQNHNLNAGDWKSIEEKAREWASAYEHLYIVCGPIVAEKPQTIGTCKIVVPEAFFKVFLCKIDKHWHTIGFVCPNQAGHKALSSYCKTIDEIEDLTGIDFFPTLDDAIETQIESSFESEVWGIN